MTSQPAEERNQYAFDARTALLPSSTDASFLKSRAAHAFSALARKRMKDADEGRLWVPDLATRQEEDAAHFRGGELETSGFTTSFEQGVKSVTSAGHKGEVKANWSSTTLGVKPPEGQDCPERDDHLGLETMETAWSRNFFRLPGLSFGGQTEEGDPGERESGTEAAARAVGIPNLLMFLMSIGSPLGAQQNGNPRLFSFFPPSFPREKTWPSFSRSTVEQTAEEEKGRLVYPNASLSLEGVSGSENVKEDSCTRGGGRETAEARKESVTDVLWSASLPQVVAEWAASLGTAEENVSVQTVPFVTEEAARLLWKSAWSLFLNPLVAFYCQCYSLASLGAVVFTTSIVHWWRPQLGIRRTLDVSAVVVVAAVHWISAFLLTDLSFQLLYFLISWTGITCYFGGCALTKRGRPMPGAWCHVALHVICTIGNLCLYVYLALQAEGSAQTAALPEVVVESLNDDFSAAMSPE